MFSFLSTLKTLLPDQVMNVGKRPTVNEGSEQASVEVHLMHACSADFYGEVRVLWFTGVLGVGLKT